MDYILFETQRLISRKLSLIDVELLFKYSQEEITKKELPDEVFENIEETKDIVEYFISNYDSKSPLAGERFIGSCYGIILKSINIIIGHIGLIEIDRGVEIGYAIAIDYQNKGYASEVINPFIEWAKKEFNINKIYGIVKKENTPSWKILDKNGFILEEEGIYENYFEGKYYVKIYSK